MNLSFHVPAELQQTTLLFFLFLEARRSHIPPILFPSISLALHTSLSFFLPPRRDIEVNINSPPFLPKTRRPFPPPFFFLLDEVEDCVGSFFLSPLSDLSLSVSAATFPLPLREVGERIARCTSPVSPSPNPWQSLIPYERVRSFSSPPPQNKHQRLPSSTGITFIRFPLPSPLKLYNTDP